MSFADLTLLLLCFLLVGYWTQKGERNGRPENERPLSVESEPAIHAGEADYYSREPWAALAIEMQEVVEALGAGAEIGIASPQQDLVITLKDALLFDSGKADLRDEVLPVLQKVTAISSSRTDFNVEVLGHADSVPIAGGRFPSNWELSAARASRVARRLIENGIDPARLSVKGYGDLRPVAPNTTAESRRINRRVEIRLSRKLPAEELSTKLDDPGR